MKKDKKGNEYPYSYKGKRCKLIASRKVWREIEFKNGKRIMIEYFDLNP